MEDRRQKGRHEPPVDIKLPTDGSEVERADYLIMGFILAMVLVMVSISTAGYLIGG